MYEYIDRENLEQIGQELQARIIAVADAAQEMGRFCTWLGDDYQIDKTPIRALIAGLTEIAKELEAA